jgi:rod shape-determining protein MreD
MIMPPGQPLLLPAKTSFIWSSLLLAFGLNMLQNMGFSGRATWAPDLLSVVLLFWCVHQPLRIGMGSAFVLGLLMDIHQGVVLGQYALSYTVLGFLALVMHRRLLCFSVPWQALQVLPLFLICHILSLSVRMFFGALFPGFGILAGPLLETLLWPLASMLLLLPQRRSPDPDENRPL